MVTALINVREIHSLLVKNSMYGRAIEPLGNSSSSHCQFVKTFLQWKHKAGLLQPITNTIVCGHIVLAHGGTFTFLKANFQDTVGFPINLVLM